MSYQPDLFDEKTESAFRIYHEANPEIYNWFKLFAFEKIQRGAKHIGAKQIFEMLRFESPVNANGDPFKVNNSFTSAYTRMFLRDYPEYADKFELRKSKYDAELQQY